MITIALLQVLFSLLQFIGFWPLAAGYWQLVSCHRSLDRPAARSQ
jgi:hypothetical protein